jgi:hypothetical protein
LRITESPHAQAPDYISTSTSARFWQLVSSKVERKVRGERVLIWQDGKDVDPAAEQGEKAADTPAE